MSGTTILPEPESSPAPPSCGRRTALVAGITAGTLAIVGAGAFAAFQFLGAGPAAEQALPAESTLAVVSLDLDPSAQQKIEAFKTLQKFPAIKKELKLSSGDDLRRTFFDQVLSDGDCKKLSYEDDVKPWIGDSVAVAAASFEKGKVSPLVALAVTDQDKAALGLGALIDCADAGNDTGYAFHGGFVLVSDTKAHAEKAVEQATARPLSDDATYQGWADKVGDRGILNVYVARQAAGAIADGIDGFDLSGGNLEPGTFSSEDLPSDMPSDFQTAVPGALPSDVPTDFPSDFPTDFPSDFPSDFPTDFPSELLSSDPNGSNGGATIVTPNAAPAAYARDDPSDDSSSATRRALKDFQGAAGTLRFADNGAELHLVGGLGDATVAPEHPVSDVVGTLPSDTTAVVGFSPPKDWASRLTSELDGLDMFSSDNGGVRQLVEDQLGLSVPDDLQTLLGDGLALSERGTPPADLAAMNGPEEMPVALTITGDADAIKGVIAKVETKQGRTLADEGVAVAAGSDRVTLSFDDTYGKDLLRDGTLADDDTFKKLVPEADKAMAVLYVDLNSAWRQAIADTLTDEPEEILFTRTQFLENTKALEGVGISGWVDGGDSHLLVKLTTD